MSCWTTFNGTILVGFRSGGWCDTLVQLFNLSHFNHVFIWLTNTSSVWRLLCSLANWFHALSMATFGAQVLQLTQYVNIHTYMHTYTPGTSGTCTTSAAATDLISFIIGGINITTHLHCLDCMLGPATDEDEDKDNNLQHMASSHHPPVHPFAHNAFHVWDLDEVIVPLPHDGSPQTSPLLLAAIPYIPSFFPLSHSPTSHNSQTLPTSPGPAREISIPREV